MRKVRKREKKRKKERVEGNKILCSLETRLDKELYQKEAMLGMAVTKEVFYFRAGRPIGDLVSYLILLNCLQKD